MGKTMVLITISSLLLAGDVVAVDGGENKSSTAGTVKSRTFNVLNYGAVGDDKTDNTEAFSACLKAVIAAGGGRIAERRRDRILYWHSGHGPGGSTPPPTKS